MWFFRRWFKKQKSDRIVLVISGGGMRGFYGLWILKALEELGFKQKIDALYGVSIWGLISAYRAAGYSADEIMHKILHSGFFSPWKNLNLFTRKSLLSNTLIEKNILHDLPSNFEDLQIPVHIFCSDIFAGQSVQFSSGNLLFPLLATIAIPWIFPAVEYQKKTLVDGGATCNFPVSFAKKAYPNHHIIGVSLNKYQPKKSELKSLVDSIILWFELLMRRDILVQGAHADTFICRKLNSGVLEMKKEKLHKIFLQWYHDGLEQLQDLVDKKAK